VGGGATLHGCLRCAERRRVRTRQAVEHRAARAAHACRDAAWGQPSRLSLPRLPQAPGMATVSVAAVGIPHAPGERPRPETSHSAELQSEPPSPAHPPPSPNPHTKPPPPPPTPATPPPSPRPSRRPTQLPISGFKPLLTMAIPTVAILTMAAPDPRLQDHPRAGCGCGWRGRHTVGRSAWRRRRLH
jgi:hypothetical protein